MSATDFDRGTAEIVSIFGKRSSVTVDQRGGGGDDDGMEARVAKLEAIVPTLATKIDLADLRAEMHKEFTAQTWRIIGAMLTFGALLSTAVFFIARNVR